MGLMAGMAKTIMAKAKARVAKTTRAKAGTKAKARVAKTTRAKAKARVAKTRARQTMEMIQT